MLTMISDHTSCLMKQGIETVSLIREMFMSSYLRRLETRQGQGSRSRDFRSVATKRLFVVFISLHPARTTGHLDACGLFVQE